MRQSLLSVFALLLLATPAAGERLVLDDEALPGTGRYERCLNLADRNPRGGYEAAQAWQTDGGGAPAAHCAALALVGLKRYPEAAARLDALGRDPSAGDLVMRAQIMDQAGNAWLLAGKGDNATASFSRALSYSINDPEILADRAQARALNRDWKGADADLSSALATQPNRADLLVLRASARHAMGMRVQARGDLDRALTLRPGYADALLERGTMRFETGDTAGARADWQQASASNTQAGREARERLESMK
jgi:tetratricopeptide (TPR) repeat protein